MHIITRPQGGRFQVCRIIPGRPPVSVGEFDSEKEALEVCTRLDLMNDNDIIEEPIPDEFDGLLSRL